MTRIDLDDLAMKAAAASAVSPGQWRAGSDDGMTGTSVLRDDADGGLWQISDRCSPGDAQHIAANSPPVTLALIARIRELEAALGELVAECEERTENPGGDYYADPREILEKGAVMP